jgi:HEPN domain-containing protein
MTENFDKEKLIRYWIESSDSDFKTMIDLFKTKNYNWSLFMGHLVIEKLLKAQYIFIKNEFPPLTHDLRRILEKADIAIESDLKIILDSISRFNINARYDDYKQSFQKLCTLKFTKEWIEKIKETRIWIKQELSS